MEYGTDSKRQSDVPRGEIMKYEWKSQIFDETARDYWIYVPAQYDPQRSAGLMVFQDGHFYIDEEGWFRVPIVFDNLINKKTIPILIGLFINPGHTEQTDNRSYEYDSLSEVHLSNLEKDMGERVNLQEEEPILTEELRGMAESWRAGIEERWEREFSARK